MYLVAYAGVDVVTWNGAEPQLGEALDSSTERRRWRATIEGRPAVVIEVEARSELDAAQIAERLRRLGNHPDASLRPLLSWARDGRRVSVATDADEGRTLDELLKDGPLTAPEAAAVGWSMLTGLQVLHESGLAHGSLDGSQVRINTAGRTQLGGQWFNPARRATSDDLLADVEAAGALICRALGIGGDADTGAGPAAAERDAPALTRTVRAIASGASGANVSGARMALAATAGRLVQPEGIARASEMLAARVRGESVAAPAISTPVTPDAGNPPAPALPPLAPLPAPAPPPAAPAPAVPVAPPVGAEDTGVRPAPAVSSQRYVATAEDFRQLRRRPSLDLRPLAFPLMVAGGILLALILFWGAFTVVRGLTRAHPAASVATPPPTARARPTPVATPSAAATPAATPKPTGAESFGPASAPPISSVGLAANGCSPGGSCSVEVTVHTSSASAPNDVTWTVKARDVCTGSTSDVATNKVTEQRGWTTVIGDSTITVPAGTAIQLAAVTSAPATAASPVVPVGGTSC
jgi:hypothetical protein